MINRLSVTQKLVLSFVFVIIVGSILLSLPISHYANRPETSYLDHLFNTVSMVCVTGLSVVPVSKAYNGLGQILSMLLMQTGGLGLVSLIAFSTYTLKNKLGLSDQDLLQSALSRDSQKDLKAYLFKVYKITFSIEAMAALVIMTDFIPRFGLGHGIFNSLFLAVSAFCNAGFDNLGSTSLLAYKTDALVNLTIAALIIMGGLGFSVWFDLKTNIQTKGHKRKLRFHTKLVLALTALILISGTCLTFLTEYQNTATIGRLPFEKKLLVSFFQTVTMRTAGFATIDYTQARPVTLLLYIIQMFLGGAPGGTAGGLKITTFLVVLAFARTEILGLPHTNFGHHTFSPSTIQKAFSVLIVFTTTFIIGLTFLTMVADNGHRFIYLMFEAMSALGTVGVTANLTPTLNHAALTVIMFLMFIGRIGPLTLIVSLSNRKPKKKDTIKFANANIIIG